MASKGEDGRVRIPSAPLYVTHESRSKLGLGWSETIYPMSSEARAGEKYRQLRIAHPRDRVAVMRRKPRPGWRTVTTIAPS